MDEWSKPTDALPRDHGEPVRLRLTVVSGPDQGKQLVLERGSYRIGKKPGLELSLSDASVSRIHLLIDVLPASLSVTDNNSSNGSFCDGLRFTRVEARPGSVLKIGTTSDSFGWPLRTVISFGSINPLVSHPASKPTAQTAIPSLRSIPPRKCARSAGE